MRRASSLEDFEPADNSSVVLQGNTATIKVTVEGVRTVYFVWEYQVGRKVRFKSHVVRVKNDF